MGGASPDKGILSKADVIARVLGELPGPIDPGRTVMIGDREHDVFGERRQGIETISVRYGYARPGELEAAGPNAIVETMADLAETLGLTLAPAGAH